VNYYLNPEHRTFLDVDWTWPHSKTT
jgi:hypothetical protein